VKKLLQAAQFQKMHYELGAEMAKRKRLLWEIKEGERQEKELADLDKLLEKLTIPLANVLEGVREKAKRAGIQLPLSQEFNRSRPNSPSCSPSPAAHQHQQLRPTPNSAQLQTPITMRSNRQQGYSFSPAVNSIQSLNRSSATIQQHHHQQQQRSGSINASPLSTPLMQMSSKCATPSAAIPGSADPRVTANLMTQSQLQTWSQSQLQHQQQQQQQLFKQSPAPGGTGMAMGVTAMIPTRPAAGAHHNSIMHSQYNTVANSRPGVGLGMHHGQHNMHPLNSIHSMHTPSAIGGSAVVAASHGGVGGRAQAVAMGRSTRTMSCSMPLTMAPGSVLSQAASR
jgi:hypothetical protein